MTEKDYLEFIEEDLFYANELKLVELYLKYGKTAVDAMYKKYFIDGDE
jgi:hypothetical protein